MTNTNAMFVDALSNGQNTVLMVTTEQLKAMVDYCMKVAKEEAEKESLAEREELRPVEYWLEKLHTTRTTLWRWEKKGLLKPTRMCGKVFYKMSDFETIKEGRL